MDVRHKPNCLYKQFRHNEPLLYHLRTLFTSIGNCLSAKFPGASQESTSQAGFSTSRQVQAYCANSFPKEDFQENVLYKEKVIALYFLSMRSQMKTASVFSLINYLMHACDTVETLNHSAQSWPTHRLDEASGWKQITCQTSSHSKV